MAERSITKRANRRCAVYGGLLGLSAARVIKNLRATDPAPFALAASAGRRYPDCELHPACGEGRSE
ncbi:MAG: hypothetical protein J2P21_24915, partial [Chloracidobacterium sp.]|nr:hypothetical protein [Chloracidobacterium sp.]